MHLDGRNLHVNVEALKVLDDKKRQKLINWTNIIPKMSIILFGLTLTATDHLRKVTIQRRKEEYKLKLQEISQNDTIEP